MTEIAKCENCEQEKEVTDTEGNLLCEECADEIVRCSFCNKLLGISYEVMEDNFGRLNVPELSLPDKGEGLIFCDVDYCLEGYLQKYKRERDILNKLKEMKEDQN